MLIIRLKEIYQQSKPEESSEAWRKRREDQAGHEKGESGIRSSEITHIEDRSRYAEISAIGGTRSNTEEI